MSDLHDNVANWKIIQKMLTDRNITTLINCGDTIAPAMLKEISKTFNGQIHTVFGNNADRALESEVVKSLSNVKHYVDHGDVTIAGRRISFNHYPEIADDDTASGDYNLVCHGHTHLKRWEPRTMPRPTRQVRGKKGIIQTTYILNPGTAGGMFQYPSFATVDLTTMTCKFHEVKQ